MAQWIAKLLDQYGKLQIADEAKNLQDNQKILATDRAVVDAHHKKYLGDDYKSPEDDDVIHVGDSTQHVYPRPSGGGLGKALLGAGLVATGIGGPLGAYLVADAIKDKPAVVQPAEPTNTETIIDWSVGEPIVE